MTCRASLGHEATPGERAWSCSVRTRRFRVELAGAALAADLLIELDPVAALRGVAALLPADLPDLAEEFVAVAALRGHSTLATGLGSGHLDLLGHGWLLPSRQRLLRVRLRHDSGVLPR